MILSAWTITITEPVTFNNNPMQALILKFCVEGG
jgi:hypothetical protein